MLIEKSGIATLFGRNAIKNYYELLYRRETKQVASLYISMVAGIALGFGVSIVNTRFLGPQWYGDLKFLTNLFTFVAVITTFGFFFTGSKLLAECKKEHVRGQLVGGLFIIASIISILLIVILFVFSFFVDDLFHPGLGKVIRIFSPLLFIFPFQMCLQNIMQGDNRIFQLAIFQTAPQALYLLGAVTFNYFVPLSLTASLALELGLTALIIFTMSLLLKPAIRYTSQIFRLIYRENRSYGFHVYLGSLANVATAALMGLLIGYFADTTAVGFYSLALAVTMPLSFIPSAFGTTLFKTFADRPVIPKKAIVGAIGLTACTLIVFFLLIDEIILFCFSTKFIPVIPLCLYSPLAVFFKDLAIL